MAKGFQRRRRLKGEAGPTNREPSAKQMQSEEPRAELDSAIEDSTCARGTALKYLLADTVDRDGKRDERQLKGLQNQMDKLETTLSGSYEMRQRSFARLYVPIILSKEL